MLHDVVSHTFTHADSSKTYDVEKNAYVYTSASKKWPNDGEITVRMHIDCIDAYKWYT